MRTLSIITAAGFGAAVPAICVGQAVPSYGLDFVTVGAPGNRATIPEEVPLDPERRVGAVAYTYRIMRSEVTTAEWLNFVRAYEPYWTGTPHDPRLVGDYIYRTASGYELDPGTERWPTRMSWRMAAIYCNWLHNGRGSGPEAFASGAYDTSTFRTDPLGFPVEQATRSPGARFWIPSADEWAKAAFYDPHRYGPGQGGYWQWPDRGDEMMIGALPSQGGETNAFVGIPGSIWQMDVGSYPWAASPWGLLDISGGEREWGENARGSGTRIVLGSRIRGTTLAERVDGFYSSSSSDSIIVHGLRVASAVPTPAAPAVFSVIIVTIARRRRE
ncbi:MAG: formylglycine-generating enzyme family protein [Phycisphaerae bacterium]|nr:formylglycine-generating enzyme family protein [Phycisphaerae bacterium]